MCGHPVSVPSASVSLTFLLPLTLGCEPLSRRSMCTVTEHQILIRQSIFWLVTIRKEQEGYNGGGYGGGCGGGGGGVMVVILGVVVVVVIVVVTGVVLMWRWRHSGLRTLPCLAGLSHAAMLARVAASVRMRGSSRRKSICQTVRRSSIFFRCPTSALLQRRRTAGRSK